MTEKILEEIAAYAGMRVAADMATVDYDQMRQMALNLPIGHHHFREALTGDRLSLICEIRKSDPEKGLLVRGLDHVRKAMQYQAAGADAVSCVTEPKWYLGSEDLFTDIQNRITLPMLRRDFVVDAYQIYQARIMGADAVNLICGLMDAFTLGYYQDICGELGMDAVIMADNAEEVRMAVWSGAKIICLPGVRDADGGIDIEAVGALKALIPEEVPVIAETADISAEDISRLKALGICAVLVTERLMKADHPEEIIRPLAF